MSLEEAMERVVKDLEGQGVVLARMFILKNRTLVNL